MERRIGIVYSWNPKGWGFIMVSPLERYFSHISEVGLDHIPAIGEQVSFEVAPALKEGKLPCAIRVTPVDVTANFAEVQS